MGVPKMELESIWHLNWFINGLVLGYFTLVWLIDLNQVDFNFAILSFLD